MGRWAPPHHPVRPGPHQAQPGSPPPGRPPLRYGGCSGSWPTTRSAMPGSHSGPRLSDGTRSATRSVVASAPRLKPDRPRAVAGPGGRPEPQCSARARTRVGHACGCADQLFRRVRTAMPTARDKHQNGGSARVLPGKIALHSVRSSVRLHGEPGARKRRLSTAFGGAQGTKTQLRAALGTGTLPAACQEDGSCHSG